MILAARKAFTFSGLAARRAAVRAFASSLLAARHDAYTAHLHTLQLLCRPSVVPFFLLNSENSLTSPHLVQRFVVGVVGVSMG